MKKLLQWLAVAVFAVLVFVPALVQAQPTTTPPTGDFNWDYYNGATTALLGAALGGMFMFCGMYLNRKRD